MSDTFCISFVYILYTSNYVCNLYAKFIQNVYTNNCIQNRSLILTYFEPIVVQFFVS